MEDTQYSQNNPPLMSERSPAVVLVLILITCGVYMIYWYYQVYEEIRRLQGNTPTGLNFWVDLLLTFVTGGIWAVYVDYKISDSLNHIQAKYGMPANDTTVITLLLDLAAYLTAWLTNLITSMIHQDQLNKVHAHIMEQGGPNAQFRSGTRSTSDHLPAAGPPATGPNPYD